MSNFRSRSSIVTKHYLVRGKWTSSLLLVGLVLTISLPPGEASAIWDRQGRER